MPEKRDISEVARELDPIIAARHRELMGKWNKQNPAPPVLAYHPQQQIEHAFEEASQRRALMIELWREHGIKMTFLHPLGEMGSDRHQTTIEYLEDSQPG